jgi:N-acetylglucosaminyldiphosphoundecaprenol N-acetyl-beta-D-mannosaminyltransferase
MMPTEYLRLGGVRVDRVDMRETLARIETFIEERTPRRIVTVNLEYLRHAHDLHFQAALDAADIAVADGMPLVWLSRLYRHPLRERIAGVDLADRCAWLASTKGYRVFLPAPAPASPSRPLRS